MKFKGILESKCPSVLAVRLFVEMLLSMKVLNTIGLIFPEILHTYRYVDIDRKVKVIKPAFFLYLLNFIIYLKYFCMECNFKYYEHIYLDTS